MKNAKNIAKILRDSFHLAHTLTVREIWSLSAIGCDVDAKDDIDCLFHIS